jgi:hypothetical protein
MKKPAKTVAITDAMTWWLTKRRAFIVGNYEITLLAINHDQDCVKILIRNTDTNEVESDLSSISLDKETLA